MIGDWRPFEPSREAVEAARLTSKPRSCNRHSDCDAADERARKASVDHRGRSSRNGAEHCNDDCCEECFGY